MGAKDVLSRKTGVIVGDDVLKLFNYAQEHKFAIPAIVRHQLLFESHLDFKLTFAECYLILNCCSSSRGCPRLKVSGHPPDVSRWSCLLCWQGRAVSGWFFIAKR